MALQPAQKAKALVVKKKSRRHRLILTGGLRPCACWRDTGQMRYIFAATATVLLGMMTCGAAIQPARALPPSSGHLLSTRQAEKIARLVAVHDHIDLSDTHVEMNSLDLMSPFIPGYVSFILMREATEPGPDETLHRYAVNRRTGDVWEMTLCTHYDFPALSRMQRALTGRAATLDEIAAERQELGCSAQAPSHSPGKPL